MRPDQTPTYSMAPCRGQKLRRTPMIVSGGGVTVAICWLVSTLHQTTFRGRLNCLNYLVDELASSLHLPSVMHMVLNRRMRLCGALLGLVVLTGAGCNGIGGPCWSYTKLPMWCDGDRAMWCSEGSEVSASVPEVQMVCNPGMCVAWVDKGQKYSGCKVSSSPCDPAQGQVCVETVAAYCSSQGVLIELRDCAQSSAPYCTVDKDNGARCVQALP